jgi:hypothetical protein
VEFCEHVNESSHPIKAENVIQFSNYNNRIFYFMFCVITERQENKARGFYLNSLSSLVKTVSTNIPISLAIEFK